MSEIELDVTFSATNAAKALALDPYRALDGLTVEELKQIVVSHQTRQVLGLYWERNEIAHDKALNANDVVFDLILNENDQELGAGSGPWNNLVIEGDSFDALRLLRKTHMGKIRVICIDPPYNTGSQDWVYNDRFVGKNDRFRYSQWLEFLYQRLMLAKDLLTEDGVILVNMNDDNRSKLELLMDQVFEGMRIGSFVWRSRDTSSSGNRNFSDVHEHVLVYGKADFAFLGRPKSDKKYKNPDNDPRGPWNADPLTLGFDRIERKNLFYPLRNPKTDIWYPCDQTRVWAYATEARVDDESTLQAETMESFISKDLILFPDDEETRVWTTFADLLQDVRSGNVPVTPKRKRPLLTEDLPDLEEWVGRRVGFGRPTFKKHWQALRSHQSPVLSWIARASESNEDDETTTVLSPQAGEGSEVLSGIFGRKVFNYPKPPTLIENILRETVDRNDTVLDFFAGSGTTAAAVLKLNQEDGGNRRFIMNSSTEATKGDPTRNLCRDICAARLRFVISGFAGMPPLGGSFAYARTVAIDPIDFPYDVSSEQAFNTISLLHTGALQQYPNRAINIVDKTADVMTVFCPLVSNEILDQLQVMHTGKLRIYSDRPDSVSEALFGGMPVESLGILDAVKLVP